MKVTALWLYPIKGIRGIPIKETQLTPQGLKYDRSFMLCRVGEDGLLEKLQLARYPQCALFEQEVIKSDDGSKIRVRYLVPEKALVSSRPEMQEVLELPLEPDFKDADRVDVNLHQSMVSAFKMGNPYDEWFTACFGFETVLLYIGDARRPVLGTFSPKVQQQAAQAQKGWLSSITSYVTGGENTNGDPDWITFTDCAPFLVTTEASLANVNTRFEKPVPMLKFRPNIVLDGEKEWDEDFWAELTMHEGSTTISLTKLCNRCTSLNVDYSTGQPAEGEAGTVLKKLMVDRRVDRGLKYSPTFGRYGFLGDGKGESSTVLLRVGDEMSVTKRFEERPMWDWPMKDVKSARFYGQA
ncbi:MOSC domain-containing protein [Sarocladium implicatum]|nr:MOSC domain-containing protein [Sarocladium implicatum]